MKQITRKSALAIGVFTISALCGVATIAPNTFAAGIGNPAFTDANFYECVVKQYDALNPGILETTTSETVLTDAQVASITTLNCDYDTSTSGANSTSYYTATAEITSTAGLNKLTGLKSLSLSGHSSLGTIDITKNTLLKALYLNEDGLTTLSLSGQPSLQILSVFSNDLTALDLSKQTKLIELDVAYNQITTLDLSGQTNLETLDASGNKLTTLDLSNNTALQELSIDGNSLTEIDVSKLPSLNVLFADRIGVIPYVEYGKTDNCELTANLKFVGDYNTIKSTDNYSFDNETHTLTIKSLPTNNTISTEYYSKNQSRSSSIIKVVSVYTIDFGDALKTEFDKLSTCEVKKEDVKVPNTGGSLTEEFDGKLIGVSVLGIATVALLSFVGTYTYNRRKHHVKF